MTLLLENARDLDLRGLPQADGLQRFHRVVAQNVSSLSAHLKVIDDARGVVVAMYVLNAEEAQAAITAVEKVRNG